MKCSLISQIFLKRSLVFPILLFSFISLHCLFKKAFLSLLAILWNSAFFPFLHCFSFLQGIFLTQGLNPGLPHCRQTLYRLSHQGIPDPLTCLLKNMYAGQEAEVRTGHGTTDWLEIGEGVWQGCILSPCSFNLYADYIMQNARLDESQLESRWWGEISTTSGMQMTPLLWQKVKRN